MNYTTGTKNILENGEVIAEIKKPSGVLGLVDSANFGIDASLLLPEIRVLIGEYADSGNEYEVDLCNRIDSLMKRYSEMPPF